MVAQGSSLLEHAPANGSYAFTPSHQGNDFESMVHSYSMSYGRIGAQPLTNDRTFSWAADVQRKGALTFIHAYYKNPWRIRTLDETPQHLTIYMPRSGSFRTSIGTRAIEGRVGQLLMANNHELGDRFMHGHQNASDLLCLDWSVVIRTVTALLEKPVLESLDLEPVLDLTSPSGLIIGNLVGTIMQGMRNNGPLLSSPLGLSMLSEAIADLIIRFTQHRFTPCLEQKISAIAPWHVRRAIDYMHANIGEPFTIAMVADAVGVSLRALQNGFKTFRGTSPGGYLRAIRLQAAHDQLADPLNQKSVREICAIWGFFHPGRFSIAYRSAFGECPKDTRTRAAGALSAH
ncbi:AraC family transcriptional regulator (plasmid) [Rhizobium sp. Pop5]|uniref:AraC family transcriptional regulator n=1 Tax=Rhizobium sp. Pop5 TaxID=1223565 RepID=UPI0005636F1E|nr:AraC family transcriptional regulator [Rhizobium sp. Pop5]UVD59834.1 AraC family transcriptional regulator [Rhizobium sp. Pop5]